jgi:uncharacterized integral membrane protein
MTTAAARPADFCTIVGAGQIGAGSDCAAVTDVAVGGPRAKWSTDDKEVLMRWIYLALIIVFAAATIIFALQNFEIVTMSFLGLNARVPLALLIAVAYLLGAVTGGSLLALLRRSYEGSRRSIASSS